MKILIAATLVACTAITAVHSKQLRTEQRLDKREKNEAALKAWYWKGMAEAMVKEVECIPLVGGKENRKYNRHEDPTSVVNDPERYWYS